MNVSKIKDKYSEKNFIHLPFFAIEGRVDISESSAESSDHLILRVIRGNEDLAWRPIAINKLVWIYGRKRYGPLESWCRSSSPWRAKRASFGQLGRSFAWKYLLSSRYRLAGRTSPRVCGFALNYDDFYDPDPLTSRPSPIRVLYGDNSSLSYIVAARPVTPLSHRSSKVRYFQDDAF